MPFSITELEAAKASLGDLVLETPTWIWKGDSKNQWVDPTTEVAIKLELFQFAGSFKPRGALCSMLEMSREDLQRGVTAISAGNHAIAVSYAAGVLGTHAKVVMPSNAPISRVEKCRAMGTEVMLIEDVMAGFEMVEQIEKEEGRKYIHPFDGPKTVLGTGTVGLELYRQALALDVPLDMAIVPIGGGGLAAGMSAAIKLCNPDCEIYGVEPHGACSMALSFASGKPEKIASVETVAKSLGAPFALPYSFNICRSHINEIVLVSD
ncbi:MAG: pyridoxal-phosphate dependent enzyme, partial [Pirellulaceae bacterium]|nr:pyridoxal-phosphate dependent enzyme [Pirellulaceae bacterium]